MVRIISPLADSRWDSFLYSHPYGSVYQTSAWLRVMATTYRQADPLCFIQESSSSAILCALPCCAIKSKISGNRLISLPFSSYSDPLTSTADDFRHLLDAVANDITHSSYRYFELRQFLNPAPSNEKRLINHSYQKIHILDIGPGFNHIKKHFHKDCVVRSVRKAEKAKLVVEECQSKDDLKAFYDVHAITRKRLGLFIQPYAFFENMWEIMRENDLITILLCKHDRKIIAGIILFKYKDTVSFEHGASLPDYWPMRPNHLLMWRSIELACSGGYRYFDFGKTEKDNIGLLQYKSRWGAAMFDVSYLYYPDNRSLPTGRHQGIKGKLVRLIAEKSPMPIAKLLGRLGYKYLV